MIPTSVIYKQQTTIPTIITYNQQTMIPTSVTYKQHTTIPTSVIYMQQCDTYDSSGSYDTYQCYLHPTYNNTYEYYLCYLHATDNVDRLQNETYAVNIHRKAFSVIFL